MTRSQTVLLTVAATAALAGAAALGVGHADGAGPRPEAQAGSASTCMAVSNWAAAPCEQHATLLRHGSWELVLSTARK